MTARARHRLVAEFKVAGLWVRSRNIAYAKSRQAA
jgi:hypothetical protein